MYVFHSSGMGVSVDVARMTTQSHSTRRLLRFWRSSSHGRAVKYSFHFSVNSSRVGFVIVLSSYHLKVS